MISRVFYLVRYPLFLYNHHYHIPDGNIDRSWKIFWPPTIWYGGKIWFLFFSLFQPALLHSISTSASTRGWRTNKVASKVRRKRVHKELNYFLKEYSCFHAYPVVSQWCSSLTRRLVFRKNYQISSISSHTVSLVWKYHWFCLFFAKKPPETLCSRFPKGPWLMHHTVCVFARLFWNCETTLIIFSSHNLRKLLRSMKRRILLQKYVYSIVRVVWVLHATS